MPTRLPTAPASPITPLIGKEPAIVEEYEASGKFGNVSVEFKFPKPIITSKMIPLSQENGLLISCVNNKTPLVVYKDGKMATPLLGKNPILPMKPIQRLQSMAESDGVLVLGHGERCLEFGRIRLEEDVIEICRNNQKLGQVSYSKLHFDQKGPLIGIGGNQLDFWDIQRQARHGTMMAKGTISDFDSCPQSPTVGAYCSGTLKIVDFRESLSSPVLLQKQPISSTILKWNPHVPYWIATANQSGLEILDIRYNGRLPLLQIPHANISQLCWSRGNCDLVLAASKDRRINLWALGNDISHCRLNTMSLDYELEALCADPIDPKQFVGLDANDSLVRFQLDQAYLGKLAPHQSDDPRFQELEGALYTRDPVALQQKLLEASKAETGSAWFRQVKQLILHSMSSTTPVPLDTNVIGSICIDDSGAAFYKLLMSSTAATQRTFVRRQSEQGSHLQALIDTLRLKIRVSELLAAQDANSLLRFTATLAQVISSGTEILSQQQLIKLCALLLKSHRKEALDFIHSLPEQPVLLWLASYPTIFDTRSYECLRTRMSLSRSMDDLNSELLHDEHVPVCDRLRQEQFDALIEDPTIGQQTQKIAQQVAYTQVKSAQSSAELEEIILSEDSEALKHIVCVEPVKELLEGLVKQDSLIPFFAVAFRLHLLTAKTPFNSGLTEFITGVAFPRLKAVLKRAIAKPFTSGPSAIRMLLAIVADPFCAFGPEQMNFLVELFAQINHLLGSECGEMDTFYKTSSIVQQILSQSSKYPPRLIAELLQQQSVGSVSRNK